jgi:hypothetical protein
VLPSLAAEATAGAASEASPTRHEHLQSSASPRCHQQQVDNYISRARLVKATRERDKTSRGQGQGSLETKDRLGNPICRGT